MARERVIPGQRWRRLLPFTAAAALACINHEDLRLRDGSRVSAYVNSPSRGAPGDDLASLTFRPDLCPQELLRPAYSKLDETDLVHFLERQGFRVRAERPRTDLVYLFVDGAGTREPVRLRVAILEDSARAGRELWTVLLQQGAGAWGAHRSNLAVLAPNDEVADDLAFAGRTKLACWGVFTIQGRQDTFVIPGGYREL